MLRYSDKSFFGIMDNKDYFYTEKRKNISEPETFNPLLEKTMQQLVAAAMAAPSGAKKFATRKVSFSGFRMYSALHNAPQTSPASIALGAFKAT